MVSLLRSSFVLLRYAISVHERTQQAASGLQRYAIKLAKEKYSYTEVTLTTIKLILIILILLAPTIKIQKL